MFLSRNNPDVREKEEVRKHMFILDDGELGILLLLALIAGAILGYLGKKWRENKEITSLKKEVSDWKKNAGDEREFWEKKEAQLQKIRKVNAYRNLLVEKLAPLGFVLLNYDVEGVIDFGRIIEGKIEKLPYQLKLGENVWPIEILKDGKTIGQPLEETTADNFLAIVKIALGIKQDATMLEDGAH